MHPCCIPLTFHASGLLSITLQAHLLYRLHLQPFSNPNPQPNGEAANPEEGPSDGDDPSSRNAEGKGGRRNCSFPGCTKTFNSNWGLKRYGANT